MPTILRVSRYPEHVNALDDQIRNDDEQAQKRREEISAHSPNVKDVLVARMEQPCAWG